MSREPAPGGRREGDETRDGAQHGAQEEDAPQRAGIRTVLGDRRLLVLAYRRLLVLACAPTLFNLGSGGMLSLLGRKLVATAVSATHWTAIHVMVAQLTMVPVALFAGSLADRRGRRKFLLAAFAVLPLRAALSAFVDDPTWLIAAEILDGVASGIVDAVRGVGGALPAWSGGLTFGLFGGTGGSWRSARRCWPRSPW